MRNTSASSEMIVTCRNAGDGIRRNEGDHKHEISENVAMIEGETETDAIATVNAAERDSREKRKKVTGRENKGWNQQNRV